MAAKMKENDIIKVIHEGVKIKGLITGLASNYIEVKIISPFRWWTNNSSLTGPAVQYHSFLDEYGEEAAKRLLVESYMKLSIIDKSLERICRVYSDLEEELAEVSTGSPNTG